MVAGESIMDTSTLIQVTAMHCNKVLGNDEQRQIERFAIQADAAWDILPQWMRDANSQPWDLELLPDLYDRMGYGREDGWTIGELATALVDIMLADWSKKDLRDMLLQRVNADKGVS